LAGTRKIAATCVTFATFLSACAPARPAPQRPEREPEGAPLRAVSPPLAHEVSRRGLRFDLPPGEWREQPEQGAWLSWARTEPLARLTIRYAFARRTVTAEECGALARAERRELRATPEPPSFEREPFSSGEFLGYELFEVLPEKEARVVISAASIGRCLSVIVAVPDSSAAARELAELRQVVMGTLVIQAPDAAVAPEDF
jgi:hypothetical protein